APHALPAVPNRFFVDHETDLRRFALTENPHPLSHTAAVYGTRFSYCAKCPKLTFKLRQGVKWHDGKHFTAKDVQCTWHWLNGKTDDYFRKHPRRVWWTNLKEVTANGDHEATFHLARPQPSVLALLGSGFGVVYPCHVAAKDQRTNPIGTGPFKFVEFKSN